MKYFKDDNNNVYAYEANGSQDQFILPTLVEITKAEADAIANPPPSMADQFLLVKNKLQSTIDDKAKEFGFSSGNALMLYAGFVNPFQSLAQTFAVWEATVWVEAGAYMNDVIAGTKEIVTPEQAVLMMPEYPQ